MSSGLDVYLSLRLCICKKFKVGPNWHLSLVAVLHNNGHLISVGSIIGIVVGNILANIVTLIIILILYAMSVLCFSLRSDNVVWL